jgi:hypothetical protein
LHLRTTYVNKNNSNKFIYQRANEIIGTPFQGPLRKIRPLTEILETKHLKLLGHVLKRPQSYPQHQVTFTSYLGLPKTPSNRRVGRPRKKWTIENMKLAWNILKANNNELPNLNFNHRTLVIREALIDTARAYKSPFN